MVLDDDQVFLTVIFGCSACGFQTILLIRQDQLLSFEQFSPKTQFPPQSQADSHQG